MTKIVLDKIQNKKDSQVISEIIFNMLNDKGIAPLSFSYNITVDYDEE
tara:strand:- start:37 stop:180 length:144 start_codon:yes stop_codon:yes gene_type:complete